MMLETQPQHEEQQILPSLNARQRLGCWLLGLIETLLSIALAVWVLTLPEMFQLYYPLVQPATKAHDAEAVIHWMSTTYRTRSLNFALNAGKFGPKELQHYMDVRAVFQRVPGCVTLLGLAWLSTFLASAPSWKVLAGGQRRGLIVWLALVVVLGGLALCDWPLFFALLHRPFFGDRSWRLPDNAYSLQLFPTGFWRLLATTVLVSPLALFALLGAVSYLPARRESKA